MTGEQLFFRALLQFRDLSENDANGAMQLCTEAIKRAPTLTQAYATAIFFLISGQMHRYEWVETYKAEAPGWLAASRSMAAENPYLDVAIGVIDFLSGGETATLRLSVERAVARAPHNSDVLLAGGWGFAFAGAAEQALECFERFRKLGRLSPYWAIGLAGATIASVLARRDKDALTFAKRGLDLAPDFKGLNLYRASAFGRLGRVEEGLATVEKIQEMMPGITVSHYAMTSPWGRTEAGRRYIEGLRLARLPE